MEEPKTDIGIVTNLIASIDSINESTRDAMSLAVTPHIKRIKVEWTLMGDYEVFPNVEIEYYDWEK